MLLLGGSGLLLLVPPLMLPCRQAEAGQQPTTTQCRDSGLRQPLLCPIAVQSPFKKMVISSSIMAVSEVGDAGTRWNAVCPGQKPAAL